MTENQINASNFLGATMDSNLNIQAAFNGAGPANQIALTGNTAPMTGWAYWTNYYYPQVIRESYPVYLQEQAKDKGKQSFEIIKILKDKKLVNLTKVSDFIDLMDELIKIL